MIILRLCISATIVSLMFSCTTVYLPQAFGSEAGYIPAYSSDDISEKAWNTDFSVKYYHDNNNSIYRLDTSVLRTIQLSAGVTKGFVMFDSFALNLSLFPGFFAGMINMHDDKDYGYYDDVFLYALGYTGQASAALTGKLGNSLLTLGVLYAAAYEHLGNYSDFRQAVVADRIAEGESDHIYIDAGSSGFSSRVVFYIDTIFRNRQRDNQPFFRPYIGTAAANTLNPFIGSPEYIESGNGVYVSGIFGNYLGMRIDDSVSIYFQFEMAESSDYSLSMGIVF